MGLRRLSSLAMTIFRQKVGENLMDGLRWPIHFNITKCLVGIDQGALCTACELFLPSAKHTRTHTQNKQTPKLNLIKIPAQTTCLQDLRGRQEAVSQIQKMQYSARQMS